MWGNKVDSLISYHRPNFHVDKNDPSVTIYVQKIKRKRTGGKLGNFNLKLVWSVKRYCDDYETIFCDPKLAEKIKFREKSGIIENPTQPEFEENPF
jgi:hypothetical protein